VLIGYLNDVSLAAEGGHAERRGSAEDDAISISKSEEESEEKRVLPIHGTPSNISPVLSVT